MKVKPVLAAASVAAATFFVAPLAHADDAANNRAWMGSQAELTTGDIVQGWTVSHLRPSTDMIPYQPVGKLWEATATDVAIQGAATPVVSNLNARARNGDTYRVLFGVATPQGVNPSTLAQGQETTGKIYFDVTGAPPDAVYYAEGEGPPLLVWVQPPPPPPGQGPSPRPGAPAPASLATPAESTAPPAVSEGTPVAEDAEEAPLMPLTPADDGMPAAPGPDEASPATAPSAGQEGTPAAPDAQSEASEGTPLEDVLLDEGPLEEQLTG